MLKRACFTRVFARPLLLSAILGSGGCVSSAYIQNPIEIFITNQQPELALSTHEQLPHKSRDQALYHLDKAVLLRMNGQLNDSNTELEAAKQISKKLDAVSLREQTAAVSVNDAMRSYLPPPFEQVMLYCFKMLNYLELNDLDGARVEALQLDVFLQQKYKEKEPAFARYLSGLVFEANGELSDALIAYRKAQQGYQAANMKIPQQLQTDLLRLTEHQGLKDEHRKLSEAFKLDNWITQAELSKQGEVIAIAFSGLVPHKHETSIMAQDPGSGQLHRISIPFYEQRKSDVENLHLVSLNKSQAGELFANIDQQANASLNDQMPGIMGRAVARVAVKNKLSDNMSKENQLLGVITNIAGFISEQADTRSWYTLPQEIIISRMPLAPGTHDIEVTLKSSAGANINTHMLNQVPLQQKQKLFFSWHWPSSTVTSRKRNHANTSTSTTIIYRSR